MKASWQASCDAPRIVYFNYAIFKTLNLVSCQRLRFVIIKPLGVDLDVNHVMFSGLAFV
jgi:hypothetical protein